MFNSSDRPGHLARWIADATRDTEGHEIEKCPHPCSYCADRVAVEQFEAIIGTLEAVIRLAAKDIDLNEYRGALLHGCEAALKVAQGE